MRPAVIVAIAVCGTAPIAAQDNVPVPVPRPSPTVTMPAQTPDPGPSRCEADLSKSGAVFVPMPPESIATNACSISDPVEMKALPGAVSLEPPALLDCPTALRFADFVTKTLQSLATKELGSPIAQIRQDSAFVCRTRNGTSKLSEHAFGRAIDIASFTTKSGLAVPVMAMPKDREIEASFLTAVRKAACGPFATVLGPRSDADHATHFHFDLAPREGGAYCR